MHLSFELYLMVLRGELPPSVLVDAAHSHLRELCSFCSNEWTAYKRRRSDSLPIDTVASREQEEPKVHRHRSIAGPKAHLTEAKLRLVQEQRRKARQDLSTLLGLPQEKWRSRVQHAQTRFRYRAFAEILIAEAQERARNNPDLARQLAELVPVVVHWIPGGDGMEWRATLRVRALAQVGNARRIRGQLDEAEARFSEVRRYLASIALNSPELHGEIASLEASLRIDQRHFDAAATLLDRAILFYNLASEQKNLAKVLTQRANLYQNLNQPAEALDFLDRAASLIDPEASPFLHLCTVTSRVLCFCDLDRADEAWDLLHRHLDLYEASDDPWVRVSVQDLRGRVLLGLECHDEAAEAFAACRDGALELGRDYDAALASLDLALVYLEQGRTAELKRLAGELVPTFQARGVDREALAALRLVHQAVTAEKLTRSVLADVRERLRRVNPGD